MKENGRLEPANKEEFASAKTKEMFCSKCSKIFSVSNVTFGATKCSECGELLVDKEFSCKKITGN